MSFVVLPIRCYSKDEEDLSHLGIFKDDNDEEIVLIKDARISYDKIVLYYPSDNPNRSILEVGNGSENALSVAMSCEELDKILK